jgi:hypothetical protein
LEAPASALQALSLKSRSRTIKGRCFAESALTEIQIPQQVESIGDECFVGCRRLVRWSVAVPSALAQIGEACLAYSALETVILPNTIECVGKNAFGPNVTVKFVRAVAHEATPDSASGEMTSDQTGLKKSDRTQKNEWY